MAERRMFTKKITDSDAFLGMPMSTQCLYFQLNMNADDDGFVNSPKKIQRTIGASESDMEELMKNRFIISFDSGVVVIKHWLMHNTIRKDRYHETDYLEEKKLLFLKENKAYSLNVNQMATNCKPSGNHDIKSCENGEKHDKQRVLEACQPNVNQMATEVRLGKVSIGKDRLDKVSIEENNKRHLSNINNSEVECDFPDIQKYLKEKQEDVDYFYKTELFDLFETEFARPISRTELMRLSDWMTSYEDNLIRYALREALTYNKKNFDYIDRILNNWKERGFTAEDYEEGKR